MRIRPTRRLPGMLFAALIIYVFATNSQVIWLYLVSALIAGLAVTGLLAPALVVRRLRPRLDGWHRKGFDPPLAQDRGRVFAGDTVTLVLELGEERAPVELGPLRIAGRPSERLVNRPDGSRVLVDVAAGSRGRVSYQAILATSSWPLGIARAQRWIALDHAMVVHPRYVLPRDDRRQGTREPAGITANRGAGDEFLGLREYRSGDSQRRIHWRTSARTGILMVVETAQETSNATAFELVLGDATREAADLAVGVAASLGAGNVSAGIPISLAAPGQPHRLHRWAEALAALASAAPGQAAPLGAGRDAVRVTAERGQVTVARGGSVQVFDAAVTLADAVDSLGSNP